MNLDLDLDLAGISTGFEDCDDEFRNGVLNAHSASVTTAERGGGGGKIYRKTEIIGKLVGVVSHSYMNH